MDAQIRDASWDTSRSTVHGHYCYRNVIDVLQKRPTPETDGREGLKSLELLIGLYQSARDGKRVNLPLHY